MKDAYKIIDKIKKIRYVHLNSDRGRIRACKWIWLIVPLKLISVIMLNPANGSLERSQLKGNADM